MGLSSDQVRGAHLGGLASGAALRHYETGAVAPLTSNTLLRSTGLIPLTTAFTTVSGTAYFVYIGQVARSVKLNKVYFVTSGTVAAGALVQEYGVATSPHAPNGVNQALTIAALDSTTGLYTGALGRYSNGGNLAYTPPGATHIWAFARWQPATTPPTIANGLACDAGQFAVVSFASVGTPLVVGQVIATPTTVSVTAVTAIAPNLVLATE